jgi:aquaporin Z
MTANIDLAGGYIAVGAILTSMVYAGGAISGGHYNPGVTLGVYLRGLFENQQSMRAYDCLLYVIVQIVAALVAGSAAAYVNGGYDSIASPSLNLDKHTIFACLSVEFLFSFLLVLAVLNAATSSKVSGNSYFGLAIGFVLTAGGITVGDFTGGCFNPAVAIALCALTGRGVKNIWVYVLGEVLGAVAAAGMFTFWHLGDEKADETNDSDPSNEFNDKDHRTVLLEDRY